MIVASPTETIVESPAPKPPPILRPPTQPPTQPSTNTDSIATRTRARQQIAEEESESIATRVKRRTRHAANATTMEFTYTALASGTMELACPVLDPETGRMLEYRQLRRDPRYKETWERSAANDFGMLAQGVGNRVKGTNTIFFIHKSEVPPDRFKDVTYLKFVCNVRTEKAEPNRTRATFGGNDINYPDDCGTPTADLLLIKIFLNSVISTPGAKFANADLSNFYYNHDLKRPEFARVKLTDIPQEIINEYKLNEKMTPDGWIYIKCIKTVPGLPQSGSLSHEALEKRLNEEGYFKSPIVPALWKHRTRNIQFVLVVDDFGIKYIRKDDLDHLINSLKKYYEVKVDLQGKEFVKIELDWDYEHGKVHLSMAPYLKKALTQFDCLVPSKRQDSPFPHTPPNYGTKTQFAEYDTSNRVGKAEQKHLQQSNGKFLYYARSVDGTMLTPLSALASQQAAPTEKTMQQAQQFRDYAATQEPAVLTYRKSGMILAAHSDAGYLNESEARSRAGGHHFLSENAPIPANNGAIANVAEIIKGVMSSAAEAEMGALYINARKAVEERNILEELGHPQPPTPIQTDNSTAEGIINKKVQPKRTKAMDMRFHWLRDRAVNQNQFRFYWRPGPLNLADYFTKHHPPAHHKNMRKEFLTPYQDLLELRRKTRSSTARVC
jgi:hypothetical protein